MKIGREQHDGLQTTILRQGKKKKKKVLALKRGNLKLSVLWAPEATDILNHRLLWLGNINLALQSIVYVVWIVADWGRRGWQWERSQKYIKGYYIICQHLLQQLVVLVSHIKKIFLKFQVVYRSGADHSPSNK